MSENQGTTGEKENCHRPILYDTDLIVEAEIQKLKMELKTQPSL